MKTVPMLNPIRKRAARKNSTIARKALPRASYVKRPSQITGTKPSKRLMARRAVAKRKGTFPNPSGETFYAQHVRAPNDRNGNSRQASIVYSSDGAEVGFVEHGYMGATGALQQSGKGARFVELQTLIHVSPAEYKALSSSPFSARRKTNPRAAAVADPVAARELFLFAVSDGDLYRQRITYIIDNLARKVAKGTYDAQLAPKIWQYAADDAAKRYSKEFGGSFTVATRRDTAAQLEAYYSEHVIQESAKFLKPGKRASNPKKSGVVTFNPFNVITKADGKVQVHDGAKTQAKALEKAEQLSKVMTREKVYVATRAWIKSHTK